MNEFFLLLLWLSIFSPIVRAGPAAVAVHVGLNSAVIDACSTQAKVLDLAQIKQSPALLPVRAGPGREFAQLDALLVDQVVWVCDHRPGWQGVVYGGDLQSCGVSRSVEKPHPYRGACKAGWVPTKRLKTIAG